VPRGHEITGDQVPRPSARLTGEGATVDVRCPAGCSGTVVAVPLPGGRGVRAGAAAAARPLARVRFTASAGRRAVVRLRFDARAHRAVRRAGGARITVTVTPRGGRTAVRRTVTVRVARGR
jgi:hypothetical protein